MLDSEALWNPTVSGAVLRLLAATPARLSPEAVASIVERILSHLDGKLHSSDADEKHALRLFLAIRAGGHPLGERAESLLTELSTRHSEISTRPIPQTDSPPVETTTYFAGPAAAELIDFGSMPSNQLAPVLDEPWNPMSGRSVALDDYLSELRQDQSERIYALISAWCSGRRTSQQDSSGGPDHYSHALARLVEMLRGLSPSASGNNQAFWVAWHGLAQAALETSRGGIDLEVRGDGVAYSLNHPLGMLVSYAVQSSFPGDVQRGQSIPEQLKHALQLVLDSSAPGAIAGQIMVASRIFPLHVAESEWSQDRLCPLLDWDESSNAGFCWQAFLWTLGLDAPLLSRIKAAFVRSFSEHLQLGEYLPRLCSLLVEIALRDRSQLSDLEYRTCISSLSIGGRARVASSLARQLRDVEDAKKTSLWKDRIGPWVRETWPRKAGGEDPHTSENLARLALLAGDQFPSAAELIAGMRQDRGIAGRVGLNSHILRDVEESDVLRRFPRESLVFLWRLLPSVATVSDPTAPPAYALRGLKTVLRDGDFATLPGDHLPLLRDLLELADRSGWST